MSAWRAFIKRSQLADLLPLAYQRVYAARFPCCSSHELDLPSHNLYEPAGSTKLPDTDISDPEDQEEEDFFAYARQVFDAKEFQRVATILRDCDSPKAVFLRLYARDLESERVAQLQWWKLSSK